MTPRPDPQTPSEAPPTYVGYVVPALLLLIFAAQCARFIGTQSFTMDEPMHIISGQYGWRYGNFFRQGDNPPLPRLWMSLLVRGPEWRLDGPDDHIITGISPSPEGLAARARGMNALLGLLLGGLLWLAARSLFGAGAANLTLALYAFSPSMIAHFSLATHDGPVTLTTFAVVWQLIRWRSNPSVGQTAFLGLLVGVHLATKFSALPSAVAAMLLVLLLRPDGVRLRTAEWNWRPALIVSAVAAFTVWGAYSFHVSKVVLQGGKVSMTFPNSNATFTRNAPTRRAATLYVPAGEFFSGVKLVSETRRRPFSSVLFGRTFTSSRWYLVPAVLLVKWPWPVWLLAGMGLAALTLRKISWPRDLLLALLFPTLLLGVAMFSGMNFRERWVLPVYPFLLLLAGAAWEWARTRRAAVIAVGFVALLLAADASRFAPHYLAYMNPLVDGGKNYEVLTDSNLDWGQGLLAVRQYEQAHPEEEIHLAFFGPVKPHVYGLRAQPMEESDRPTGTVIVSATRLAGAWNKDPAAYLWLTQHPQVAVLGHVMYVFRVAERPGATP